MLLFSTQHYTHGRTTPSYIVFARRPGGVVVGRKCDDKDRFTVERCHEMLTSEISVSYG